MVCNARDNHTRRRPKNGWLKSAEDKSAPTDKKVQAAVVASLSLAPCLFLGEISNEIENTFHA